MTTKQLQTMLKAEKPSNIYRIDNAFFYQFEEYTFVAIVDEVTFNITVQKVSNGDLEEFTWKHQDTFDEITKATTKQILALN
jgi:hypothetical protein